MYRIEWANGIGDFGMKRIYAWIITPIQYIKRSFFRKMLLAFFTIIILTVTSLGANFYFETSDNIKQSAISNMERTTEQAVQTLQLQMGNIKNDAWSFFGDEELQTLVKKFSENSDKLSYFNYKFSIMGNNNSLIEFLMVKDKEGIERIQKITNNRYYGDKNLFETEKLKLSQIAKSNNGKEAWVLVYIYDTQKKQMIQTIAYTQALKDVYAELQPIVGNMTIILSFDKLQNWLSSLSVKDHGNFYLVNKQDSRIILSTESSNIGKTIGQSQLP
jgi:two-component system sensor histidine kinase YesM